MSDPSQNDAALESSDTQNENSLAHLLANVRERSSEKIPADKLAVMDHAIAQLKRSLENNPPLAAGQRAPEFTLPTSEGPPWKLAEALQRGPVILSFFRGAW